MTVGILGGGQLGKMTMLAAHQLGIPVRCWDCQPEAPASRVGEMIVGEWNDPRALSQFVEGLQVATYEFENIPPELLVRILQFVPVRPAIRAIEISSDRLLEKTFFSELGIPVAPFALVDSRDALTKAIPSLGLPCVLKTRRLGYDGKGQFVLRSASDAQEAWTQLRGPPKDATFLLESFVSFDEELSIIAVRAIDGAIAFYPVTSNIHENGILRTSRAPAPWLSAALSQKAQEISTKVLEELQYVGVLTIELFRVGDHLIANEMAPRVHNSGHWTLDGAATSQFENHLRAILGLTLGSTQAMASCQMTNLIGETPSMAELCRSPRARIHIYGKSPRIGRKLGHVTEFL